MLFKYTIFIKYIPEFYSEKLDSAIICFNAPINLFKINRKGSKMHINHFFFPIFMVEIKQGRHVQKN